MQVFKELGVHSIVRLNEIEYQRAGTPGLQRLLRAVCAGTQGVDTFLRRTEEQFCPESDSEYIVMMK